LSDHVAAAPRRPVESFRYPAVPCSVSLAPELMVPGMAECKARDRALQQEIAAAVEAARKQGLQDGLARASAAAAKALEHERLALQQALRDFTSRQGEYFRRVEREAVRLALFIARKILHREAQMDPLLLAGVVRVALDQMQAGTKLVLRTSTQSAASWAEFCAKNLADQSVEVTPDNNLESGQCVLQAEAGSAEISLDSQLREIESGFFDLLREKLETGP